MTEFRYLRNFYRFRRLLQLDEDGNVRQIIESDELERTAQFGFFIEQPQLIYLIGSAEGPMLYANGRRFVVGAETVVKLEQAGSGRHLTLRSKVSTVAIVAPISTYADPNFDDPEMEDFFIWVEANLNKKTGRERLTIKQGKDISQ